MRRNLTAAVALATLLTGCGGATTGSRPSPAASARPAPSPAATSEPIHIESSSSGDRYITVVQRVTDGPARRNRVAYKLRAVSSRADITGSQSVVTFEQPYITFNDRQGKTLIANSPQAKITQRDKSVLMRGGVHARAGDGSVLTCDTLRYDGRTELLHGQGNVVLIGPTGLTLTGNYLEGDVRLDDVRVAQHPL